MKGKFSTVLLAALTVAALLAKVKWGTLGLHEGW